MDSPALSSLLDTTIASLLAGRQQRLMAARQVIRVVISGDDLTTLPETLNCLAALSRQDYLPLLAFSHSARDSALQQACLAGLACRGIEAVTDNQEPGQTDIIARALYLPALSANSMSKIALGIRDNLVCRWVFHQLACHQPVIVTLCAECLAQPANSIPVLRDQLLRYAATLADYGCRVISPLPAAQPQTRLPLLTLKDIRLHPGGQPLRVRRRTLITPAARDEIRSRGIVIVESP